MKVFEKYKSKKNRKEVNLDISDLTLSDQDAIALSYLTPGLSRRIQSQILSQLPTSSRSRRKYTINNDEQNLKSQKKIRDCSRDSIHSDLSSDTINDLHLSDSSKTLEKGKSNLQYYKLSDLRKQAEHENSEESVKYKPYRPCYRSTSLMEPNSYKHSLYSKNNSLGDFESIYEDKTNITPTQKYSSRDLDHDLSEPGRVSRFLRPDFYSNCLYSKEKQKREIETQKVLQEIRNKRNMEHKSTSVENEIETTPKQETKEDIVLNNNNASNEKVIETPKINNEPLKIKRESKISKLIRPKSLPVESTDSEKLESKSNSVSTKKKLFNRSASVNKTSPSTENSNQFLNSIEKKIRSIYLESNDKNKTEANNSRIKSTIRTLREQSEPRNIETCVTESGLIKRAVSSEDFSVFGSNKKNTKTLQPSRKSVTKILGLFKKYEDKDKTSSKTKETKDSKIKSKNINKTRDDTNPKESKIKTKSVKDVDNKTEQITKTKNDDKKFNTTRSKLPVSPIRYTSLESEIKPDRERSKSVFTERRYPIVDTYKPDRKNLKLDLKNVTNHSDTTNNENGVFSPSDDSSMCSDFHQDMSPISDYRDEEANESVIDRIRRKSFYCRFNEKKKPRKSAILDNKFDYYDSKYADVASSSSNTLGKTKKVKDNHRNDIEMLNKSFTNSQMPTAKDVRDYRRGFSMNDNFYTYNPNRYRDVAPYSSSIDDEKFRNDVDSHKSLIAKPKKSNRKSSSTSRFSDTPHTSKRDSITPNNDSSFQCEPSTSISSNI